MAQLLQMPNVKIDKTNPVPRYHLVREKIEESIALKRHRRGDKLPSERELVEHFGVSRITIRRAIDELARDGIVSKEWGSGIYVKKIPSLSPVRTKIGLAVWQGKERGEHPGTHAVLEGIGEVIGDKGYGLEIVFISEASIKNKDYSRIAENKQLAGIIMSVQEVPQENVEALRQYVPHLVCTNRYSIKHSVSFDYAEATGMIVDHLFDLGHTHIGLVNGPAGLEVSEQVLLGYKKKIREKRLQIDEKLARNGDYVYQAGFMLATDLLIQEKPTAIIAGDDFMALGALKAIREAGLHCPRDVSLCSFNDFPLAQFTAPPLTTVRLSFYELAKSAARMLVGIIEGKDASSSRISGELIVRDTTRQASEGCLKA